MAMPSGVAKSKPAHEAIAVAMATTLCETGELLNLGGDFWMGFRLISQYISTAPQLALDMMREQWFIHSAGLGRPRLPTGKIAAKPMVGERVSPPSLNSGCVLGLIPGKPAKLRHWLALCCFHKTHIEIADPRLPVSKFRETMVRLPPDARDGVLLWAVSYFARAFCNVYSWSEGEINPDSFRHRVVCLFPPAAVAALEVAAESLDSSTALLCGDLGLNIFRLNH